MILIKTTLVSQTGKKDDPVESFLLKLFFQRGRRRVGGKPNLHGVDLDTQYFPAILDHSVFKFHVIPAQRCIFISDQHACSWRDSDRTLQHIGQALAVRVIEISQNVLPTRQAESLEL